MDWDVLYNSSESVSNNSSRSFLKKSVSDLVLTKLEDSANRNLEKASNIYF